MGWSGVGVGWSGMAWRRVVWCGGRVGLDAELGRGWSRVE